MVAAVGIAGYFINAIVAYDGIDCLKLPFGTNGQVVRYRELEERVIGRFRHNKIGMRWQELHIGFGLVHEAYRIPVSSHFEVQCPQWRV